ncbi:MAG: [Fe-Fe] hydrogenase large subunit C-terminal domain-containing protein [Sphaerochaetaceae bacterium]
MPDIPFHHTLAIRTDICQGCTHCMKRCPSGAIRISGGKAHVSPERCIDCGQCMNVCPHHAIKIEESDFEQIFQYKYRVAIVPAVFFGQFEDTITDGQIIQALGRIGFTHIHFSEFGVDILRTLGNKISVYADDRPVISSYCPAVIRLIQIRYPGLLKNINLMRTPAQITALYARLEIEKEGGSPQETGVFYISPCAAKYAQIKTPNSATSGLIQGGLNLDSVFNLVQSNLTKNKGMKVPDTSAIKIPPITSGSAVWCLTKGESSSMPGRTLAVDEVHNVIEFLEMVEEDKQQNLDFLELRACATGCTGGVLTTRNRFLATERIKHRAIGLPADLDAQTKKHILELSDRLIHNLKVDRLEAKHSLRLDQDVSLAIQKMEKARRILEVLPGIDCGLCGSPSCSALAEDIARSVASIRQCAVLKLKDPNGLNTLARIWGEKIPADKSDSGI